MAIGHIKHGAFHKWLGKSEGEPITGADIEKGLKAGGHAAKMAAFAKAARKFKHKGKGDKEHAHSMYGRKPKSHSATG
jgi:hypothetical protein